MLERYTLRTQILVSFVVLSTISLLIVSSINIANITVIGDTTTDLATESLEDQIKRNMGTASAENSLVIERKINRLIAVVESMATATEVLFTDPNSLEFASSFWSNNTNTLPLDATTAVNYDTPVSFTHSVVHYPDNPEIVTNGALVKEIIDRSAHLDPYFSSQYENNGNFYWMYVGFQRQDIFRVFPGTTWDSGYNHKVRPWYDEAKDNFGEMSITSPYRDAATGQWMITIARAIYYQDGSVLGVAAGDILIGDIQEKVLSISFLDSGYATLYQNDGVVVVHPEWDYTTASSTVQIGDVETLSPATLQNIAILQTQEVVSDSSTGVEYFVAHSRILDNYILLIIVLRSEAIESIMAIEDEISDSQGQVTSSTILLSLVTLVAVLGIGLWVASIVTRPVQRLTELANQITKNVTGDDILQSVAFDMSLERDDEIGALTRSFSNMVQHLREEQKTKKMKK